MHLIWMLSESVGSPCKSAVMACIAVQPQQLFTWEGAGAIIIALVIKALIDSSQVGAGPA